ncbi:Uncharacterised protein [Klebsiella pneumoniae]|nr:Uncharacterised protein [Klebsiella pneumoniae]SVM43054.1 Uncharacterised protein [Klebsiella pneumoniae]SVN05968.1 Uncharacterised protein [Klebsiella pneumoniae]
MYEKEIVNFISLAKKICFFAFSAKEELAWKII